MAVKDPFLSLIVKRFVANIMTRAVNQDAFIDWCRLGPVEPRHILSCAATAMSLGTTLGIGSNKYAHGNWELFRPFTDTGRQTDGTLYQSDEEEYRRKDKITTWTANNTCAVDVVLFFAIMFNLWRCQMDQIHESQLQGLDTPLVCLYFITRAGWGNITQQGRNELRDLLHESLQDFAPRYRVGSYLPAADIIVTCFSGVPQMSFTIARGRECCEGFRPHGNGPQMVATINCLMFSVMETLQSALDLFFGWMNEKEPVKCRKVGCPGRQGRRRKMIMDRLPYIMVITLGQNTRIGIAEAAKVFDKITIRAVLMDGREIKQMYTPCGALFLIDGAHFIGQFLNEEGEFYVYDGQKSDRPILTKARKTGVWFQKWPKKNDGILVTLFLRMN
jgi:hypothetical protein